MLDRKVMAECKHKLLTLKADLLNRFNTHLGDFKDREVGGDEVDQSVSLLAENQLFITHQRLRRQLLEIESALMRMEKGTYGICEVTEEPIEPDRLLAIPWTRLSIEGAELESARTIMLEPARNRRRP